MTTISAARLLSRLDELAAIGGEASGGVTRLAFSAQELAAKQLLIGWYGQAGVKAGLDAAGNVIAVLRGDGTGQGFLATGSHVDTVVAAGALDGAYGAVAAVEVASVLARSEPRLRHDVMFAAFSNEEGARGAPGFSGSLAVTGQLTEKLLSSLDDEGVSLAARVRAGGGIPARIGQAAWAPGELACFIELHVEQGPVLDASGERLGAVTSCPGRISLDVELRGVANHAGTTPMALRADALAAAAEVVLEVERLATSGAVQVATTGLLHTEPGVRNVVPGFALLGIDIRDGDDGRLAAAAEQLASAIEEVAHRRGVEPVITTKQTSGAVACNPDVQAAIARAAATLGHPIREMASGAGHDAQIIASLGPIGMIFVPSVGGRSHCPQETTDPDDLVLGAQLLLASLVELDVSPPARHEREALS